MSPGGGGPGPTRRLGPARSAPLRLCYSTPEGELRVAPPGWGALGRSGDRLTTAGAWVPLPPGSTVARLPGRAAVGRRDVRGGGDGDPGRIEALPRTQGVAVAAILPVGHLRLLLPAHGPSDAGGPALPLFGYTALADRAGELVVAAMRTDRFEWWRPERFSRRDLPAAVAAAEAALPGNPVIAQLRTCALTHNCYTAQNTFHRRYEAALPTSAACNADCLGCLSLQTDSGATTPQPRIARAPGADQLLAVAAYHLEASPRGMVSFGQGCEGEPLLRTEELLPVVRAIRARFPDATVHLNSNGSRPDDCVRLADAGLNSARISVFSFTPGLFAAYYRPRGYTIDDVCQSARRLHDRGVQVAINLLTFPGVTDAPGEVARTLTALGAVEADQVQLRTLNVDPLWLLGRLPRLEPGIGLGRMVTQLRQELPRLRLGNFTRPVAATAVPAAVTP